MRKTLRAEVEKGFARTAFDRESVDPKAQINLVNKTIGPIGVTWWVYLRLSFLCRKGIRVNIPEPGFG
jgi:hypothetical protein